jgi:hypothetical protein
MLAGAFMFLMQAAAQARKKEEGKDARRKSAMGAVKGWLSAMRSRALSATRLILMK